MPVLDWLLASDPAIRWQVLRDLVCAPGQAVAAERARVATEGWGAKPLAIQGKDGQWAGGACFPARSFNWRAEGHGQPWTATLPLHFNCCMISGSTPVLTWSARRWR
jgi:hypothetical protein